jgi:hypothetical protein
MNTRDQHTPSAPAGQPAPHAAPSSSDDLFFLFTAAEQADHCEQLAAFLETSVDAAHYDHGSFVRRVSECGTTACALGWAAMKGIGGLVLRWSDDHIYARVTLPDPRHPGIRFGAYTGADLVFGPGAYDAIFDGSNSCMYDSYEDWPDAAAQAEDHVRAVDALLRQARVLRGQED